MVKRCAQIKAQVVALDEKEVKLDHSLFQGFRLNKDGRIIPDFSKKFIECKDSRAVKSSAASIEMRETVLSLIHDALEANHA